MPSSSSQVSTANRQENSPSTRLKSICFGTLITTLAVTPLDVLKVRLQSQLQPHHATVASSWPVSIPRCSRTFRSEHLEGIFDGISKIARSEGFFKLWRGFTPTLLMAIPNTVIYFHAYHELRDALHSLGLGASASLIAGASARTLAVACISPIELFRTRMQSYGRRGTFSDVYLSIVRMTSQDGIGSLWRGLPPTLLRDVPFSGIYWFCYEGIRRGFKADSAFVSSSNWQEFMHAFTAGAASGAIAAALTTPFDVVKTLRQVSMEKANGGQRSGGGASFSLFKMLVSLWRQEGLSGLTRGIEARVAKCAPSCAILIGCFELGKRIF